MCIGVLFVVIIDDEGICLVYLILLCIGEVVSMLFEEVFVGWEIVDW